MLAPGDPAPWFVAPGPGMDVHLHVAAGRYVLLAFLPLQGPAREAALSALGAHRALFDDRKLAAFGVLRDETSIRHARDQSPGLHWIFDPEGGVSRLYGALSADGAAAPQWLVLDPALRVLARAEIASADVVFDFLKRLPAVDDHAETGLVAPVLVVPRVFEPALCRRLIDYFDADGGADSGVMREVGGRTVGVMSERKKRRDAMIQDEALRQEIRARLQRRLAPEIRKAFQFEATRLERYIVARYDCADGGFFRPHRDNTTSATRHRKFAVSINLNAEAFEGGDLRFPEFGSRTYRPPTGGAVVFSCSVLHEATPVTRGVRYACLPFLYDEAGEAIRARNLHRLVTPDAPTAPEASAHPA